MSNHRTTGFGYRSKTQYGQKRRIASTNDINLPFILCLFVIQALVTYISADLVSEYRYETQYHRTIQNNLD